MAPNSDAEDFTDEDIMEEVILEDDVPPDDEEEVIDAVEDFQLMDEDDDNEDVIEIIDDSRAVFSGHEASVFCVGVSQNVEHELVVSGGEDDRAYVWNYKTAERMFECTGHTDSVISCSFSGDSKYVMSCDMAGNIRVFGSTSGKLLWEYECSDVEWCRWHPSAHVLFAGTSCGDIYMLKVPSGDCKIYASHGSKTTCACVPTNGKEIVTGYEDGSIKKWDLKAVNCIFHHKPLSTTTDDDEESEVDPVLCVDVLSVGAKNGNLVVFGKESGMVTVLNSHNGKLVSSFSLCTTANQVTDTKDNTTEEPMKEGEDNMNGDDEADDEDMLMELTNAVESVAFSPCGCYIAAGSVNGCLCIWDISLQRVRHKCTSPAGISKLLWTSSQVAGGDVAADGGGGGVSEDIVAACLDGVLRVYDHRRGELVKEMGGHMGNILDVALTKDGKCLVTAGDDATSRVFDK